MTVAARYVTTPAIFCSEQLSYSIFHPKQLSFVLCQLGIIGMTFSVAQDAVTAPPGDVSQSGSGDGDPVGMSPAVSCDASCHTQPEW